MWFFRKKQPTVLTEPVTEAQAFYPVAQSIEQLNVTTRHSVEQECRVVMQEQEQVRRIINESVTTLNQSFSEMFDASSQQKQAIEVLVSDQQSVSLASVSDESQKVIRYLLSALQAANERSAQVEQSVAELKSSVQKMRAVLTEIQQISDQTNLLALNAAVEAARAGEHGRGFAVVANEVRALAGKSADAAKDIKLLINDSVDRIDAGTKLADKSGEMLAHINQSVAQVAAMIESISSASREQTTGISQVHLAIADIDRVTQENAALVEETTAAAESLSSEANGLRDSMAFFKTGAPQFGSAQTHTRKPAKKAALPSPKSSTEWSEF